MPDEPEEDIWEKRKKLILAWLSKAQYSQAGIARQLLWEFSRTGNFESAKVTVTATMKLLVADGLGAWKSDGADGWVFVVLCEEDYYRKYLTYDPATGTPREAPPPCSHSPMYKHLRSLGWEPGDITGTGESQDPKPKEYEYHPTEDWTPEELQFWIDSLRGDDPAEIASRLTPDVLVKASSAVRYLVTDYRRQKDARPEGRRPRPVRPLLKDEGGLPQPRNVEHRPAGGPVHSVPDVRPPEGTGHPDGPAGAGARRETDAGVPEERP